MYCILRTSYDKLDNFNYITAATTTTARAQAFSHDEAQLRSVVAATRNADPRFLRETMPSLDAAPQGQDALATQKPGGPTPAVAARGTTGTGPSSMAGPQISFLQQVHPLRLQSVQWFLELR